MGTQVILKSGLAVVIWLCPFWWGATPVIPSLLWCGTGLGLLLLLSHFSLSFCTSVQKPLWLILLSLGVMITWRSATPQNTVAAWLCLAGIGLAAHLAANWRHQNCVHLLAWAWLFVGLVNAVFALAQYFGLTIEPKGTAFGFLRQRNQLATLCIIGLLGLLYLWQQRRLITWLAPFSSLFLIAALAATCSRVGLLELSFLVVLLGTYAIQGLPREDVIGRRTSLSAIVFLLASYCLFAWALPLIIGSPENLFSRVASTADGSAFHDSRRLLWDNTLTLIHQSPLTGKGWRELAYALHMADFGTAARFSEQADNAHNLPLHFAAELGLPFTVCWLLGLLYLILRNKPWRAHEPEHLMAWGVLMAIGIHSLLEYPLWYGPFQFAAGCAAGIVFSKLQETIYAIKPRFYIAHWCGICLVMFCAYATFDYYRISQLFLDNADRASMFRQDTMAQAEQSWLFAPQVRHAKLSITPITQSNAAEMYALAKQVMHFSPEPRVFQYLITAGEQLAPEDPTIAQELVKYRKQLRLITLK